MFQLVYASTAAKPFTDGELFGMLARFREKNTRAGITGLLVYKDGSFMQVLEGDEETVRDLYDIISRDQRHHELNLLLKITVPQRQFPDWSMGFKQLESGGVPPIDGYKAQLELPPWVDILPWKASVALKLLATFNETE
jgi:hypothetical protein